MPKLALHAVLLGSCLSLTGCVTGFHGGYYDPCGGCVYGPGFHRPGLLTKLFHHKHKHDRDCPLCAAEHEHGHAGDWSASSFSSADCAAPATCAASDCAVPAYAAAGAYPTAGNCAAPADCSCAGGVSHHEAVTGSVVSGCSSCGGYVDSAPLAGGCSGCAGEPVTGCSGCGSPMVSDGGIISGGCAACAGGHVEGPVYEGEIRPGDSPGQPVRPAPAPAAEPDSSAATVTPGPETTMMIPAFAEQPPTKQVHWVPSSLK